MTEFIGYPIWWGGAVWPVNHFVTDNDFTGEKVIPFATSASSPLGSSGSDLATMIGTGDWQEGQRLSSNASAGEVSS
ncbi:flavodoxin [Bifidobacterium hominis]|uniref:flavodoxin n=1 Tax=Bifidobacterium hominis TaxID=3133177 RepID=UPI001181F9AD